MTGNDDAGRQDRNTPTDGPLTGLRVLDVSTVYAAPITAMLLGDFGAEVIKIEHPNGDPARTHGWSKDGHGLWWKVIARNKHTVTLNLSKPAGQDLLRRLVADADVLVENFRPSVLEKWNLGPDHMHEINPRLVVLRVTGFGQTGPYARRRAFGTQLLRKAVTVGADAVIFDLEDAVPPQHKVDARTLVAATLAEHPAWVRVNAARTPDCAGDLAAVADRALGIKIPKTESPDDVAWVADRAPGKPLICAIETARGVLAAQYIAAVPGVQHLAMGGLDLQRDLAAGNGNLHTLYARSHLVLASRAAGIEPPVDSVYSHLNDEGGLREQAEFARNLGFFGKSAIHPRQLPVLHEVFTPSEQDLDWARQVVSAFEAAGGDACQLPDGEFVDLPVARRARELLHLAARAPRC